MTINADIGGQSEDTRSPKMIRIVNKLTIIKVKEMLRKMKLRKALGPVGISI